ncbi:MAG TPA: hypothetical protein VGE32_01255 [Cellvibrio sp.]
MARTVLLAQHHSHKLSTGDEVFLQRTAMPSQYDPIGWTEVPLAR